MIALDRISLSVDGLRFEGLSAGPKSGELVLFLHGFPQFSDSWTPMLREMSSLGFHAVAVDQRGYSADACPRDIREYGRSKLVGDVVGFADFLEADQFHLVGHDWGAAVAWAFAAAHPERLKTLTALSSPHLDALSSAIMTDPEQRAKSADIQLFRAPGDFAEKYLLADDAAKLRAAYMGKLPVETVNANIQRFQKDGALTAALNWYRAMDLESAIGEIHAPTLYIWGDQDQALGKTAALATQKYCTGPYRFEPLAGRSHWLLEESPEEITRLVREQVAHSRS
jgi:pimeloyl-ACP methyl ester carboxylesterase